MFLENLATPNSINNKHLNEIFKFLFSFKNAFKEKVKLSNEKQ